MLPNDNFYRLVMSHTPSVSRGKSTVKKYLSQYFQEYIDCYKKALIRTDDCDLGEDCYNFLQTKLPILEELCNDILRVFEYYDSGKMVQMYNYFSEMMDKIEPLMSVKNIENVGFESFRLYYRMREGNTDFYRKDLFHIPMDKRHLIKSYRYSIPGHPCLYLASGAALCWFECGMPKEFSYAAFSLNATDDNRVKIIDFTMQPLDVAWAVYLENINNPDKRNLIYDFLAKYLLLLPLRIACSMKVMNRDVAFIEEYTFPQQLLLWVRENGLYDGIAYRTSSVVEKSKEWNYINLVMPAKEIEDGYSKYLNRIFTVSKPAKVKISDFMDIYNSQINDVKNFIINVEEKCGNEHYMYPYRELISICKTFLRMSEMLSGKNHFDAENVFQTLDTLVHTMGFIKDSKKIIKHKSMDEAKKHYTQEDESNLEQELEEVLELFEKDVEPIINELRDYYYEVLLKYPIDFKSYEHVFNI